MILISFQLIQIGSYLFFSKLEFQANYIPNIIMLYQKMCVSSICIYAILCISSRLYIQYLCFSSRKLTFFDFYDETAASAIRIVLYSIPSGETASHSLSLPLTVIFCPGSMPGTFLLSNSSPCAQHARTSVIMQ